jgi:hypothetical protein
VELPVVGGWPRPRRARASAAPRGATASQ